MINIPIEVTAPLAILSGFGLAGIHRKRPWGPAVACLASTCWAIYACCIVQPFWAGTECAYAVYSAVIATDWYKTEKRRAMCEDPTCTHCPPSRFEERGYGPALSWCEADGPCLDRTCPEMHGDPKSKRHVH